MSGAPIRLLVVDDHPLLREGIAGVLEGEDDLQLVAEAADGDEAVAAFRAHRPDVTLMDLQMPRRNGVDAIIAIRAEFPGARIIVLTTYAGDAQALRALQAGAQGYLLKSSLRKELVDTVRGVMAGRRRIAAEVAGEIAAHAGDTPLSAREIEILRGVAAGNSNKIVAARLGISEETVKAHMKSILAKLGANDRTHAVTIGLRRGILDV
ncbi:MAG: DNA-binding response regulator [Lysobacterales bacterium 69-70]|nr:MAG: DNA-binding response regulator [Xanthomonadaceae bacterium SCN 69-320]ODV18049.1 MAG: DNA-binding response regulator [Xanthomonadaceae bacterium SCN 69-25]OJZ00919.1 MAG: DNA-binding response regulator [Xanthomonadales bacterium 69-70]